MNSNLRLADQRSQLAFNMLGVAFGVLVIAIGVINLFWGNDPVFGAFLMLMGFVFFPFVNDIIRKVIGFRIPVLVKILLAVFIIWAALGVGELFDKIEMMKADLF